MTDPRVQLAVWTPRWAKYDREALAAANLTLFQGAPIHKPWRQDDPVDPYTRSCTVSTRQFKQTPDLWRRGLPAAPVFKAVAEKAAALTSAFVDLLGPRPITLLSMPGDYEKAPPSAKAREKVVSLQESSHLDEGRFRAFGNLSRLTTFCIPLPAGSHAASRVALPVAEYLDYMVALPPYSFAIWQGRKGRILCITCFPSAGKSSFAIL